MSLFRLYPGSKMSFKHNSVRKNLPLSACFCWDSRLSLREMDQKFIFGGRTIGYGDSYLEFLFRHFKVFRLHIILHDAAGTVRAQSGKGPGYFYMIGRGPKSCLLGPVTGLLFCLYVKLFLPSIFNSVDFWSSMSCIVPDIELADKNIINGMGVFLMAKLRDTHFVLQKSTKPKNKPFGAQEACAELCGTVDVSILQWVFKRSSKSCKGWTIFKGTEKCKTLGNFLDREVENLEHHGCPKVQDLVDEEIWICSSYPLREKTTLHCAEQKAKLLGNWIIRQIML